MKKQPSHCGNCLHNEFNICKAQYGYYFYGEAIDDEEVDCEDFELNPYAYQVLINEKQK